MVHLVWGFGQRQALPIAITTLLYALSTFTSTQLIVAQSEKCQRCGNYCSRGKVKSFSGSITTSEGLRVALEAISYKQEVIFTMTTHSEFMPDLWAQLHNDLVQLCYDHFLLLTTSQEQCTHVTQSSPQPINCVWDSTPRIEALGGILEWTWHLKHRLITRAIRLGYNVLYMDADMMVLDGFYQYVKPPGPLSHVQMLTIQEQPCGIQASFFYIQNVAPDGPVAWLFNDATEQPLRWLDEKAVTLIGWGKQRANERLCMTFDQAYLDDALHSAALGQVARWRAVDVCMADDWIPAKQGAAHSGTGSWKQQVLRALEQAVDCPAGRMKEFKAQHSHPQVSDLNKITRYMSLTVPRHTFQPDVPGLAGWQYQKPSDASVAGYVSAYRQLLKEDAPDQPWWPQLDAVGDLRGRGVSEVFAFAPLFLAGTMRQGGHQGSYATLQKAQPAVLVHLHRFELLFSTGWGIKVGIRKHFGMFNSSISRALRQPENGQRSPWGMGHKPGKLLVLHPDVQVASTSSYQEYIQLVSGLLQVAQMLGRHAVIPDVPCDAAWLHHPGRWTPESRCQVPMNTKHVNVLPYAYPPALVHGTYPRGQHSLRVAVGELLEEGCRMGWGGTLTEPEWAHWQVLHDVRLGGKGGRALPSKDNMLLMPSPLLRAAAQQQQGILFVELTPSELMLAMARLHNMKRRVLYLGAAVTMNLAPMPEQQSKHINSSRGCQGMWADLQHPPGTPGFSLIAARVDKHGVLAADGSLSI